MLCRLGFHKWKNYGEVVLIEWKEPGFVPGTKEKIQKLVHAQRKCTRCGIMEKTIFADNIDGTKSAVGRERISDETPNPTD